MTKLVDLQRRFWQLISAPDAVGKTLPELAAQDPEIAPLASWIRSASDDAAIQRLDVYANMYFFRLLGVLRDDYPNLVKLLGDGHFHNLVTGYLVACPSENPSIRHVGAHLAGYLAGGDLDIARRFPAAADLARLEWARGLAFDAADSGELGSEALAAIPPERWGALRFALGPSFRIAELAYPAHRLWQALERGEEPPVLEPAATEVLVWRRRFSVYHRPAGRDEARLLRRIADGASFGALCEDLAESRGDQAVQAAYKLLTTWIDQGLLASMPSWRAR